jgi:hypothetical protein
VKPRRGSSWTELWVLSCSQSKAWAPDPQGVKLLTDRNAYMTYLEVADRCPRAPHASRRGRIRSQPTALTLRACGGVAQSQMERMSAACMTVASFDDRINQVAGAATAMEHRLTNMARLLKVTQSFTEVPPRPRKLPVHNARSRRAPPPGRRGLLHHGTAAPGGV